jgi:hypothetical protein
MRKNDFEEFWKKLSSAEIRNIRENIKEWQDEGKSKKQMISSLSRGRKRLKEDWKAERVYRTEEKKMEVKQVKDAGKKFNQHHFKVFVERNACPLCQELENKIFTDDYLRHRQIVPRHPQCRCSLLLYNP